MENMYMSCCRVNGGQENTQCMNLPCKLEGALVPGGVIIKRIIKLPHPKNIYSVTVKVIISRE